MPSSRVIAPERPSISRRRDAGFFSSSKSFCLPAGAHLSDSGLRGYYVDLRIKTESPLWPPPWLPPSDQLLWVNVTQWGLGSYERYVAGEGDEWLQAAISAANHLLAYQTQGGSLDGAWFHHYSYPHTFRLDAPWVSAITQGQAASLFMRLYTETRDDRFAESAVRSLSPMDVSQAEGGVQGVLAGSRFPEEYPTSPSSCVLNGAIFALWGYHDVDVGLGDRAAREAFVSYVDTLAANIHRWDTGFWSRYDLFPHPVRNVASSFYHGLHVVQLEALNRLEPRAQLAEAQRRFAAYAASARDRRRAFERKALFRLVVPRNRLLAHRLPWA